MAQIPLAMGDWRRQIPGAPDITLVNRFFEQTPDPEHGPVSLIARPGLKRFLTIGDGPIRGVYTQPGTFSDALFAVSGDDLYSVATDGTATLVDTLSAGSLDAVSMAATPNLDPTPEYLFLADGGILYVYDGATVATVATPDSVEIISVGFIAGYVICVCAPAPGVNGRYYWIEPGEITIDPLNFATAERAPDPLYSVRVVSDQFWLLGSSSTEVWFLTGQDAAPFQRVQARVFDRGVWEGTDALVRDTIVLVDATDGTVYAMTGEGPRRISNHSIEERIRLGMVEQKEGAESGGGTTYNSVILDFKNGSYSINGVSVDLEDAIVATPWASSYNDFAYTDIVAGVGWRADDFNHDSVASLSPAAFAAIGTAGFTGTANIVTTVDPLATGPNGGAAVVISYDDLANNETIGFEAAAFPSAQSEYVAFQNATYSAEVNNEGPADGTMSVVTFDFLPTAVTVDVDGGTAATISRSTFTPELITFTPFLKTDGWTSTSVIERIEITSATPNTVPGNVTQTVRAWSFSLDGHDFYVLNIGTRETVVCDLATGQWAQWKGAASDTWRAIHAANWSAIGGDVLTTNTVRTNLVAGDREVGVVWFIDPELPFDQSATLAQLAFDRIVTGGVPMRMRDTVRCNEVYLMAQKGVEGITADATVTLETSDDAAQTWVDQGAITVVNGDYSQEMVWRSLGLIGAPGRVFRITDNCLARIDGLDMR